MISPSVLVSERRPRPSSISRAQRSRAVATHSARLRKAPETMGSASGPSAPGTARPWRARSASSALATDATRRLLAPL